jgi:ABC-2 type transport system ATP-binding protein
VTLTAALDEAPAGVHTMVDGSATAIETFGLTKRFGDVAVVDDLHLSVPTGSVFGFLGPNGSGKTTTIRMLLGLLTPSAGHADVLGRRMPEQAADVLPHVGALVEGPAFYPWLTGAQNLIRFDRLLRHSQHSGRDERVATALERVGLTATAGKKYKAYSLGMRQRLGLACALLQPRRLLILDEPTNGMDPQGTREIRHLIRQLADDGATIFLSSHLLAEIEQVCTHVAVLNLGRLITQGSLAELQAKAGKRLRLDTDDTALATQALRDLGLSPTTDGPRSLVAVVEEGRPRPEDVNRALVQAGVGVAGLAVERPSLEDTFVALTGEGFDVVR